MIQDDKPTDAIPLKDWIAQKSLTVQQAAEAFGYTRQTLNKHRHHAYVINGVLYRPMK